MLLIGLIWEHRLDTKELIGSGPNGIAIAFRGTASLRKALSDIKVCTTLQILLPFILCRMPGKDLCAKSEARKGILLASWMNYELAAAALETLARMLSRQTCATALLVMLLSGPCLARFMMTHLYKPEKALK